MVALNDLMFLVNDDTKVCISDNNYGDILLEGLASDLWYGEEIHEYEDDQVMDVHVWENTLNICVDHY